MNNWGLEIFENLKDWEKIYTTSLKIPAKVNTLSIINAMGFRFWFPFGANYTSHPQNFGTVINGKLEYERGLGKISKINNGGTIIRYSRVEE